MNKDYHSLTMFFCRILLLLIRLSVFTVYHKLFMFCMCAAKPPMGKIRSVIGEVVCVWVASVH